MRASVGLALATTSSLASCSRTEETAPVATRPVEQSTCTEPDFATDLTPLDRVLVPLGNRTLGVETAFGSPDGRLEVISGGYFDDILEAYDNLAEVGVLTLEGSEASLLESDLLGESVHIALWRIALDPPCDARAIIAVGFDRADFDRQLQLID